MKIKNETDYSTRELRKIFIACEKHEGTDYKHRHVRIIYCSGRRIHGYAWYDSCSIVMKLPKTPIIDIDCTSYASSIHTLAQVYIHEVGHNLNLHHREMMKWWEIDVSFIGDNGVLWMELPKQNQKISKAEKREQQARTNLDKWEKKLAKAKTFVKKYKTKIKYYDRRKAASTKAV